jgi:hypothetical protein
VINLIKLQPSLSIVLVAFHATEIQCLKQGLRSYALLRSAKCQSIQILITLDYFNRSFSSDVTAAILVYQNNEMAAILVYGTGISSFLFKYFVLFHHPTGATDHVSENDLYRVYKKTQPRNFPRNRHCFKDKRF